LPPLKSIQLCRLFLPIPPALTSSWQQLEILAQGRHGTDLHHHTTSPKFSAIMVLWEPAC
jgi:hypothetical protein